MRSFLKSISIAALFAGFVPAMAAAGPVRIAVIDSGVARTATLDQSIETEIDMVQGRAPFSTKSSHGTSVATVIVRAARNPVRIVSLRIDKDGKCDKLVCRMEPKAIVDAVRKAIEMRVDIINLSIDTPFDAQLYVLLQNASNAGITIVMAAGNEDVVPHGLRYAQTIGARFWLVGAKDGQGRPAGFSARPKGDCACQFVWREGVDVATQDRKGQPIRESGTSFAAPLLAAELADKAGGLVLAAR
jgi:subtilisin family serine protease